MERPNRCRCEDFKAPRGANNSCLHDVEEDLLPQAVLAFEELVLGVGAGDISADQLLTGRRHLQQLRVLVLHRHVSSVTQQLPDNGPEMMGNTFPDQLLVNKWGGSILLIYVVMCLKITTNGE